jgi:D-inositol-3-phosphate glycosyltransferase
VSWPTRLRWLSDARAEDQVVAAAREVIAISPYVLAEFQAKTAARFHLVENPVADVFFAGSAPPAPGNRRLLCVARIIPRKGILALIEAFAIVAQEQPQATLALVGEQGSAPEYAAACHARANAMGIANRVAFLGALPPEQVRAEYAAADIFVLASEQETAPVSIAEAMAVGRPVATTDVGGCAAMVEHGVTGLVVPPRNGAALADALAALLANPTLVARMGRAGHEAAHMRFRLEPVVQRTLEVYRQVLAAAPPDASGRRGGER